MAGQRISAPIEEAELWRKEPSLPTQSRKTRRPNGGRKEAREGARRTIPARALAAHPALPLVALPVLGALVDELTVSRVSVVFAVCAVLGTAAAVAVSSRAGWWWVTTAAPVVVLAVAGTAEYLAHRDGSRGKALATGAVRWVTHAFPVMAAAVLVALLVVVVRTRPNGRGRRG